MPLQRSRRRESLRRSGQDAVSLRPGNAFPFGRRSFGFERNASSFGFVLLQGHGPLFSGGRRRVRGRYALAGKPTLLHARRTAARRCGLSALAHPSTSVLIFKSCLRAFNFPARAMHEWLVLKFVLVAIRNNKCVRIMHGIPTLKVVIQPREHEICIARCTMIWREQIIDANGRSAREVRRTTRKNAGAARLAASSAAVARRY